MENPRVIESMRGARRADGTPLFTIRASAALLIFYVLAMQCFSTLAITRRETGSWKWAILQFSYMSAIAYVAAFGVYQGLGWLGVTG